MQPNTTLNVVGVEDYTPPHSKNNAALTFATKIITHTKMLIKWQ